MHLIDLERTGPRFTGAMNFISSLAQKRGTILFLGARRSGHVA
ncbi:hypothetical protein CEK63_05715 [Xanthomonas sontii]|nr:hypothetical protein CEK63_05715 [Xanthomonas sontii]